MRRMNLLIIGLLFCLSAACTTHQQPAANQTSKSITTADLSKLRWIEGSWRGTGDVEKPFFERYRFDNDTTLIIEGFPDESFTTPDDTSRYVLKDGHFGNEGDIRWEATAIDEKSIMFVPVAKARNAFRWAQESPDVWIATLDWPATADKPARQRVYRMERVKK